MRPRGHDSADRDAFLRRRSSSVWPARPRSSPPWRCSASPPPTRARKRMRKRTRPPPPAHRFGSGVRRQRRLCCPLTRDGRPGSPGRSRARDRARREYGWRGGAGRGLAGRGPAGCAGFAGPCACAPASRCPTSPSFSPAPSVSRSRPRPLPPRPLYFSASPSLSPQFLSLSLRTPRRWHERAPAKARAEGALAYARARCVNGERGKGAVRGDLCEGGREERASEREGARKRGREGERGSHKRREAGRGR